LLRRWDITEMSIHEYKLLTYIHQSIATASGKRGRSAVFTAGNAQGLGSR